MAVKKRHTLFKPRLDLDPALCQGPARIAKKIKVYPKITPYSDIG
jgi:hypothetical protein